MVPVLYFDGNAVEVFDFNGRVLFNPRHVGECLDIAGSTLREHLAAMTDRQVVKLTNDLVVGLTGIRILNNAGENFLTESGVYKLVFKSRKPSAEKFQDWVTDEVLPAIRKTGSYVHSEIPVKVSEKFHEASEVFGSYHKVCQLIGCDKNVSAISANQAVNKQFGINFLEDLGQTHLVAVKQEIYFTPTELGKDRGLSGKAFNMILESIGLQRKEGKKWVPTESGLEFCKILDTGKKSGSGVSVTQMKWSEKVLPLIPSMN